MALTVTNYGATLIDLIVPDKNGKPVNVSAGLCRTEQYLESSYQDHELHLGGSIGRYAGRLSEPLTIENKSHDIYAPDGVHLHGGRSGFDRKYWKLEDLIYGEIPSVTLSYVSPHTEEGYPGNLRVRVTYALNDLNELIISYEAETDQTTIVNLTNHAYFNLNGKGTILDHMLQIHSDKHLEVNSDLIPTGNFLENKLTRFDYLKSTSLSEQTFKGLDDTFVLNNNEIKASLFSDKTGIKMNVYTNQPALVVFTPKKFPAMPLSNEFGSFPAICFEAQNYPDAPKHVHFPSSILKEGERYINKTKYSFTIS